MQTTVNVLRKNLKGGRAVETFRETIAKISNLTDLIDWAGLGGQNCCQHGPSRHSFVLTFPLVLPVTSMLTVSATLACQTHIAFKVSSADSYMIHSLQHQGTDEKL
jgi:hypothetical protein